LVNSGLVLRQCALDGAGVALLSDWLIGADLASGRLIDLLPQYTVSPTNFQTTISAVYPSRKQVPRKVKVLVEFLRRRLQTVY
jgi:DNA-binding transcriptional LysR family regulator